MTDDWEQKAAAHMAEKGRGEASALRERERLAWTQFFAAAYVGYMGTTWPVSSAAQVADEMLEAYKHRWEK